MCISPSIYLFINLSPLSPVHLIISLLLLVEEHVREWWYYSVSMSMSSFEGRWWWLLPLLGMIVLDSEWRCGHQWRLEEAWEIDMEEPNTSSWCHTAELPQHQAFLAANTCSTRNCASSYCSHTGTACTVDRPVDRTAPTMNSDTCLCEQTSLLRMVL